MVVTVIHNAAYLKVLFEIPIVRDNKREFSSTCCSFFVLKKCK